MAGRVTVISPSGQLGSIPAENVAAAEAKGYRVETEEQRAQREFEAENQIAAPIGAFAGEAASTATLGLSDVAGEAIGGEDYAEFRRRSTEASPVAAGLGTAAGVVAPALLTGGTSAAAQGAAKGGATALAKTAATGALKTVSAPARAALGLGSVAERAATTGLARLGVTGDSLLARAAIGGAKMGAQGTVEGALFGAGEALSETALAPGGDYTGLAEKLWAGAAEGARFGALTGGVLGGLGGVGSKAVEKLAASGVGARGRQVASEVADAHTLKAMGYYGSDIAKLSTAERSRLASAIRDMELEGGERLMGTFETLPTRVGKLTRARDDAGQVLGGMRKRLDEVVGATDDATEALKRTVTRIDEQAQKIRENAALGIDRKIAAKLEKEFAPLRERLEKGEKFSFDESHAFRRRLDDSISWGKRGTDAATDEFINARRVMEDEFETAAERTATAGGDPKFLDAYSQAKGRYGTLAEVSRVAQKRAGNAAGNRSVSLTDTIAGGSAMAGMLAGANPLAALGSAVGAAAVNKLVRSTASDAIVARLAEAASRTDGQITKSMARWFDRAKPGATAGRGSRVRPALVAGATSVHTDRVLERKSAESRADAYFRKVASVEEEANAPERAPHPDAPQTSRAMEGVRRTAAQFLLEKAPMGSRRYSNPVLARIARQRPPDEGQMRQWARYVETVENPLSVLDSLEAGTLNRQQVETLQTVYPSLYTQIRERALGELVERGRDMAYGDRIQLGVLLGIVTDPSMRPESLRRGQASYATAQQKPSEAAAQSGGRSNGGPSLSISDKYSSRSDGLDAGMEVM